MYHVPLSSCDLPDLTAYHHMFVDPADAQPWMTKYWLDQVGAPAVVAHTANESKVSQ